MKCLATICVTIVLLLGSAGAGWASNRIPITGATQKTCFMATTTNGNWERNYGGGNWERNYGGKPSANGRPTSFSLVIKRAVEMARKQGFTELECDRHVAEGWIHTTQSRRANHARLRREAGLPPRVRVARTGTTSNRIPITSATQNTCYMATNNNGNWESSFSQSCSPSSRQIRSTFLWFTVQPSIRSNSAGSPLRRRKLLTRMDNGLTELPCRQAPGFR